VGAEFLSGMVFTPVVLVFWDVTLRRWQNGSRRRFERSLSLNLKGKTSPISKRLYVAHFLNVIDRAELLCQIRITF
jgi:hypothetical protein